MSQWNTYFSKSLYLKFIIDLTLNFVFVFATDVDLHLDLGMQMLLKGQLNDALSHIHMAVESDPKNYLTYFKRSTVYQAMGRYKSALEDLNESLNLNPNFLPARLQKAIVLYRQGNLDEAHIDFELILRIDPHNSEAFQYYSHIETFREQFYDAQQLIESQDWYNAIGVLNHLVQEFYWSYKLKEMRAHAFEQIGDVMNAVSDIRSLTRMRSDNTDGFYKLSKLHYIIGEPDESLAAIRECLKLDPDHKECHNHYKKVKKLANLYKNAIESSNQNDYATCADKIHSALKVETETPKIILLLKSKLCHCLGKDGKSSDAVDICTEALQLNPDDPYILCDRADAYLNLESLDDASSDYKRAYQIDESLTRAKEGYNKVEKLKRRPRNYYQILGVARTSTKKEILRAYRKLASKWHPDQYQGNDKGKAEKMFIDIAAAKEVLTDPEKREKFDNGEDPLDPEQQSQQGFNPFTFHQGSFGGSGYTFKFHFN